MLCEGLGVRATARLADVDIKTVLNVLEKVGEHCADFLDQKLINLKSEPVEIDECWTFVHNKRELRNDSASGDFYAFLASGLHSKIIMSYYVGKRDQESGNEFTQDIKFRMMEKLQVTSDGWVGFIRAFIDIKNDRLHYATQQKKYEGYNAAEYIASRPDKDFRRYSPGKCVHVKTDVIHGNPDPEHITTSHAERLNGSVRHFNKRFTRLSCCFSKKLENLIHSVALTVAYHNFCRPHAALKLTQTDGSKAIARTPAQAAGLATHCWTVAELITATV